MADFDLQQTDQQVQNILNDGQSAMGAGAQTTLTTEYVMLKDVNGVYHKILKDSLTEACRNVLAGLLVNNDKGTTINQIPAIAGGDLGSVTPANLASVLGVNIGFGSPYIYTRFEAEQIEEGYWDVVLSIRGNYAELQNYGIEFGMVLGSLKKGLYIRKQLYGNWSEWMFLEA